MPTKTFSPDETIPKAVDLMQNMPSPCGSNENTLQFDYDKERLFVEYSQESVQSNRQSNAEAFSKLFDNFRRLIGEMPSFIFPASEATRVQDYITLSNSLARWFHDQIQYQGPYGDIPQNVLRFCQEKGVLEYLRVALGLSQDVSHFTKQVSYEIEQDPETDEEWLAINIGVLGEVSQVLEWYDKYTDVWVSIAPWPQRTLIRLSYDII